MGTIDTPAGQSMPYMTASLPVFLQQFNTSTVVGGPHMMAKIGTVAVSLGDVATNMPWREQMSGMGLNGALAQNGIVMGTTTSTAIYPNSTNPTTALPVNTALTANLPAGLGGQGLATVWNLAATDMVMMQYLNPVGSVNQSPSTLKIKGIKISAAVATAAWTAPAAGSHLLQWGLAWGHTAATVATVGDTASYTIGTTTVKGNRRKVLGLMGVSTGAAAIGTLGSPEVVVNWDVPITVNPGEYVTVLCKIINGAATATGGLYFTVDFDAFFE